MRLAVTLVTGLRDAQKVRVLQSLGYDAAGEEIESETDEDFALVLAEQLVASAEDGARGRTAVHIPAEADPVEIALVLPRVFAEHGRDVALQEIVAVATAPDLRSLLFRDGAPDELTTLGAPEQLALQLEFATAVVVTDAGSISPTELLEIRGLLSKLNPSAKQLELTAGCTLRRLDGVRRASSAEALGRTAGWMLALSGAPLPTSVHGIGCVVYRDPRPFHPVRLAAAVDSWLEPADAGLIVRSRGLVRLATRADRVGSWSTAGEVLAVDPTTMTSWNPDATAGQEMVFFGRDLNRDYIVRVLDSCLLSDDELVAGPMEWETYYDPFPVWTLEHGH
jgi:G3E family GTPase